MRVLLLADIHANLPALEAVLAVASTMGYDEMWCLGDLVGYGPFPNECARIIEKQGGRVISGNHEVKGVSAKMLQEIVDRHKGSYKAFIFNWTHHTLAPDVIRYLKALPQEIRLTVKKRKVVLLHGSPRGQNHGLTVFTPETQLALLAAEAQADVLCVGHTHEAFFRTAGNAVVINPGSVGRSFDGDPRGSFMLLEFTSKGVEVVTHRVAYDLGPVVAEMRRQEFPDLLIRAFLQTRSPGDVVPDGVKGDLMEQALAFGVREGYEKRHALQVARLALRFFDELFAVHGYPGNGRARALLQAGAILHDVGMRRGTEGHHKASRDMILEDKTMALSDHERAVVALIARYHRRSLPKPDHKFYNLLPDVHKTQVERLGALLRIADGLDRSHQAWVEDIACDVNGDAVKVKLTARENIDAEINFGKLKSDLFVQAFSKKIEFVI